MADAIGEDHPGGVGRKFPAIFRRTFLKGGVFFHGVVAAVHEFVVGRAIGAGKAQAIVAWFYPNDTFGVEFIFAKPLVQELARDKKETVVAGD